MKDRNMHICFLSSIHSYLDKRVHYKEAVSLAKAGYKVTHIASADVDEKVIGNVTLVSFKGKKNVLGRLLQLPKLYRLARRINADVYHCNEVESWLVGVLLKFRLKCKVVFDVHEIYSANISERLFPKLLQPLVTKLVKLYFRLLLFATDRLVLAKESVLKDIPKSYKNTILVRNYTETQVKHGNTQLTESQSSSIKVVHLGAINKARGWPQLLAAMQLIKNPNVELSIVGHFGDNSEQEFKQKVTEFGLNDKVSFKPWINYEDVPRYTANCQIGIIAFQPVHDNFVNALPHKLFDYMLQKLPVVVPNFAIEVANIVNTAKCGFLIDTTKPDLIAKVLDKLAEDENLRKTMGENGYQAVVNQYNWENEAKTLINMYRELEAL